MNHIIYIPFTGVGKVQYKGDEWLKDRIKIFKSYTLPSLFNQTTHKGFKLWLSFRAEDLYNPLVDDLRVYFDNIRVWADFTYDGLAYYDDRNEEKNRSLVERLGRSLEELSAHDDYIYLTRIDSDDMFRNDAIELIQRQEPNTKALTFQLGFVYNKDTNELAEWNPLTNPPFHTVIFPRDIFFYPQKHIDWYEGFKSHEDIARLPHRVLWQGDNRQDRLYCVLTHNPAMHISTTWNHPFKGKEITEGKEEILKQFGIQGNR